MGSLQRNYRVISCRKCSSCGLAEQQHHSLLLASGLGGLQNTDGERSLTAGWLTAFQMFLALRSVGRGPSQTGQQEQHQKAWLGPHMCLWNGGKGILGQRLILWDPVTLWDPEMFWDPVIRHSRSGPLWKILKGEKCGCSPCHEGPPHAFPAMLDAGDWSIPKMPVLECLQARSEVHSREHKAAGHVSQETHNSAPGAQVPSFTPLGLPQRMYMLQAPRIHSQSVQW